MAINREWADTILGCYIHGAAAVAESITMDGQSIGSKVAAAVTHNSDSQQVYTCTTRHQARAGLSTYAVYGTVGGDTK